MRQEDLAPDSTLASSDSRLISALANYLSSTRGRAEVRDVIRAWCHDVARAGVRPEQVLIEFNALVVALTPSQQSKDPDARLPYRRELIALCIEEYFAKRD